MTNWLFSISTSPLTTTHSINLQFWFGVAVKVTVVPANASSISAVAVPYWFPTTLIPFNASNTA